MTEIVVGRELSTLHVLLVAGSDQRFGLTWTEASSPANLIGLSAVIRLDNGTNWTATNTGSTTMWNLTSVDTELTRPSYTGRLALVQSGEEIIAFRVLVEVQR